MMNKNTERPTPETDAASFIIDTHDPENNFMERVAYLETSRTLERQRDEAREEVARLRGVLEIIADPKAELPNDGRTTCRIYEDMAQAALDQKGGGQ